MGARSVVAADIDNDGDIDVLAAAKLDGSITLFQNTTTNPVINESALTCHPSIADAIAEAFATRAPALCSGQLLDAILEVGESQDVRFVLQSEFDGFAQSWKKIKFHQSSVFIDQLAEVSFGDSGGFKGFRF